MQIHKKAFIPLTQTLRRNQTPWENIVWRHLRAGRLQGLKFKRQVMIGEYIVDFCCNEKKLIIELDGGQHSERDNVNFDRKRQLYLEAHGYKVLRFWNNDVGSNIEGVIETIKRNL